MNAQIEQWFRTPPGQALLAQEVAACRRLLPSGYYPNALQCGQPTANFLADSGSGTRFYIGEGEVPEASDDSDAERYCGAAVAAAHSMPFAARTHDLIVLPHVLEFCDDPPAVLREASQVLTPQGCIAITGFNARSLWGAARLWRRAFSTADAPWNGQFHSIGGVQDWLAELGFALVGAAMMVYRPPLHSASWREKLEWMEDAGARWWPGFGAVYVLIARKQEIAMHGAPASSFNWRQLLPGMVRPGAQPTGMAVHTTTGRHSRTAEK